VQAVKHEHLAVVPTPAANSCPRRSQTSWKRGPPPARRAQDESGSFVGPIGWLGRIFTRAPPSLRAGFLRTNLLRRAGGLWLCGKLGGDGLTMRRPEGSQADRQGPRSTRYLSESGSIGRPGRFTACSNCIGFCPLRDDGLTACRRFPMAGCPHGRVGSPGGGREPTAKLLGRIQESRSNEKATGKKDLPTRTCGKANGRRKMKAGLEREG